MILRRIRKQSEYVMIQLTICFTDRRNDSAVWQIGAELLFITSQAFQAAHCSMHCFKPGSDVVFMIVLSHS